MVNRLNQTAKELAIDENKRVFLEFHLAPAILKLEVFAMSSEVTIFRLQRYLAALPCFPLVESVVKSPDKEDFLVEFRTESG